jgi:hypothetical protein
VVVVQRRSVSGVGRRACIHSEAAAPRAVCRLIAREGGVVVRHFPHDPLCVSALGGFVGLLKHVPRAVEVLGSTAGDERAPSRRGCGPEAMAVSRRARSTPGSWREC